MPKVTFQAETEEIFPGIFEYKSGTVPGLAPRPEVTADALPDGAYWHNTLYSALIIKWQSRLWIWPFLHVRQPRVEELRPYHGYLASLRRLPEAQQHFYAMKEGADAEN